ncbi:MAG: hypothetical protein JO340_14880 [Acidobacteriaceae bacterium]|nr:hypothetical protein [Acidobacteriaceae bacterium]
MLADVARLQILCLGIPIAAALPAQTTGLIVDAQGATPLGSSPTLRLVPQATGARAGAVRITKDDAGLVIDGSVTGPFPEFAKSQSDLMTGDHVELWLNLVRNPELPPLGWGHQFGDELLPKGEESCSEVLKDKRPEAQANCQSWAKAQSARRTYFRRLFTRQWQMAPGLIAETFARPAYDWIASHGGGAEALEPKGAPRFVAGKISDNGYEFHVSVPWQAFPPSAKTKIEEIAIVVEVFSKASSGSANGPYATTAPGRKYGQASTFSILRLQNPRLYEISPCAYDVVGLDMRGTIVPGYFLPGPTSEIETSFVVELNRRGYQYEPGGPSPITRTTHFFSLAESPNVFLCGPILRYRDERVAHGLEILNSKEEQQASLGQLGPTTPVLVSETGFAIRNEPDGVWLIKTGPRVYWSEWGSGQCGACPRAALQIYSFRRPDRIDEAFEETSVVDCEDDFDIKLSADWQKISVYRYGPWRDESGALRFDRKWQDSTYCLVGDTYQMCGSEAVPAPLPRVMRLPGCGRNLS